MRTKMKMGPVSTVAVFLLCCSVVASKDPAAKCDIYGETGKTVTLTLQTSENPSSLKWSKGKDVIFYKRGSNIVKGAAKDVDKTGSLILTALKKENEGNYKPGVFGEDGTARNILKEIYLCVLDRVKKPVLKMKCENSDMVKFTCESDPKDDISTFDWLKNGVQVHKENKVNVLSQKAKDVEKDSFSCRVSNPVSSETSDSVVHTCFKSEPTFPEELFGISIWIFVGGGGGIVLVLILIVILCCIRTRRKKKMRLRDAEEFRLNLSTSDQHHHYHHQQQPHPPHNNNHDHPAHDRQHQHQHHAAGHTGPRQNRPRNQRPRAPEPPEDHPNPLPRRGLQAPIPANKDNDEQPPPLPQPRKKAQKIQKA